MSKHLRLVETCEQAETADVLPSLPIDLSIIIVSYNTCALTRECLNSIADQTCELTYEIIVVDNGSSDGSLEMLQEHKLVSRVIHRPDNPGFAVANNVAAEVARGRRLLLLNPDTLVLDRAIDRIWSFANRKPKARIWGGRTLFADGSLNPTNCWQRMTLWNVFCRTSGLSGLFAGSSIFNGEGYAAYDRSHEKQVDIVSGCFLLIDTAFWDELGGFDPQFYMYGEEADLCLRARKQGARPRITPDATIIHYGGASETTRTGKMIKLLAAKSLLIERHWHPSLAPLGRRLFSLWPWTRATAFALLDRLKPGSGHANKADTWQEIWDRRDEWQNGYPEPGSIAPAEAALPNA